MDVIDMRQMGQYGEWTGDERRRDESVAQMPPESFERLLLMGMLREAAKHWNVLYIEHRGRRFRLAPYTLDELRNDLARLAPPSPWHGPWLLRELQ